LDNSPAAIDGTLECGDELLAINNERVSGRHKLELSKMIESSSVSLIFLLIHIEMNHFYNILDAE